MFLFLIVLFPVVPICMICIVLLLILKIRGVYTLIVSITAGIMMILFNSMVVVTFIEQMTAILKENISTILQGQFPQLEKFFSYTTGSWFVMVIVSLLLASIYKIRKERNQRYEKAGVKTLEKEVREVHKQQNSNQNNLPHEGVFLGCSESHKKIFCPYDAKHFLIAGTTGAGKTVALANFIHSAMEENFPILLVDGKGDISNGSMLEITKNLCQQYKRNLIIIDMNNPEKSAHYNPFAGVNATVATDMIINMTEWSEEHYKSNTKRYLQRVTKLLIMNDEVLSFESIITHMSESGFFLLSNALVEKKIITKEEHKQNEELYESAGKVAQGSFARFATLAESETGKIFCGDGINITTAIKNGDVILFVLNPLLYPDTSNLLGRLILIDSKQAVSNLFDSNIRKFFVFDEVNVYASNVLLDLVNKSRSANVTCLLGTQSLADLEAVSPQFKQQTIENCNNYIVLRQNASEGAEEWAKTIGTHETMKMTYQISSDEEEETQKGSARRIHEFLVHPDAIKNLKVGTGYYISRDTGIVEKLKINKPF